MLSFIHALPPDQSCLLCEILFHFLGRVTCSYTTSVFLLSKPQTQCIDCTGSLANNFPNLVCVCKLKYNPVILYSSLGSHGWPLDGKLGSSSLRIIVSPYLSILQLPIIICLFGAQCDFPFHVSMSIAFVFLQVLFRQLCC